jgi:hypothetical protein
MPPKYGVPCPTCGADPGATCRTLTTGRTTDTHIARVKAAYVGFRKRWVMGTADGAAFSDGAPGA